MITICAVHNDAMANMDEMNLLIGLMPSPSLSFRADWLYDSPDDVVHVFPREPFRKVMERAYRSGSSAVIFIGQPARSLVVDAEWHTWYVTDDGLSIAFAPSCHNRFWADQKNVEKARAFWEGAMEL